MPEIGLSGLLLDYPNSGSAVYARNLVPLLPEAAPDLTFRLFVRGSSWRIDSVATQTLSTPFARLNHGRGLGARIDKLTWEVVRLPAAAAMRREALLHSLYFAAPIVAAAPVVVTIHDVIPLVVPGYHRSRQSALYSRLMALTGKRASHVLTVSQHSKADIVRVLGIPERRVHVTYEAVDGRFSPNGAPGERERLQTRYRLPDRYVLYTGGAEKRKNLSMLIHAWARVARQMRDRDVTLVVVARFPPPDRLYPDIPALVCALGLKDAVCLVPQVEEEDKPALYRGALAFCFPSLYEGFGFTPLEAMASGLPVLASDTSSIPEIVGDGGLLLPPTSVELWAEALTHVVESQGEREALRRRGLARAATFSWRRTAEQTVTIYREVLSR